MQGSFAFAAANGLLRKVVPSLQQFDTLILDLTEVSFWRRQHRGLKRPVGRCLLMCLPLAHAGSIFKSTLQAGVFTDVRVSLRRLIHV